MNLSDNKADILATSRLIWYRSFLSVILSLLSSFLLYLKRFFPNLKGLSDASEVSLTKNEYGSTVHFI